MEKKGSSPGEIGNQITGLQDKIHRLTSQYVESLAESTTALEEHVETLTTILESIGAGLLVIDRDRKLILGNRAAVDILGADPDITYKEQLTNYYKLYRTDGLLLEPDDAPIIRAMKESRPVEEEIYVSSDRLPPGGIWIQVHATPIKDRNGETIGAVNVFHDVTEQKNATDRISKLYNGAPCGYHSLDATGVYLEVNRTVAQWLGVDVEELVGLRKFEEFLTENSVEDFRNHFCRLRENEPVSQVPLEVRNSHGDTLMVLWSSRPQRSAAGEFIASSCTVFDVTERNRIEQQRDSLATLITHDIKNHLAAERTLLDFVMSKDEGNLEGQAKELLNDLRVSNNRYLTLVTNLLHLYRIEKEAFSFKQERVNLKECIDLALQSNSGVLGMKRLHCVVECAEAIEVMADRSAISHVIHNLIHNAAQVSPENSNIRISVAREGSGKTILSVTDNGPGISEEQQSQIFQPRWKWNVRNSTMSSLGLALCKQIVDMHKGEIRIESEVGAGSTFKLYI